jgi:uncharacterized membrane protein YcaP (DUF421 family)
MHLAAATLKRRFPAFGKLADGTPVVVIDHGQWRDEAMDHLRAHCFPTAVISEM